MGVRARILELLGSSPNGMTYLTGDLEQVS